MSRAVRIERPGLLRVIDVAVPEPGRGDAVVRVAWAGICGSDSELMDGRRPAAYASYPIVPGHEWSGTVAAVGDDVDPHIVGRPAVGEGFRSCQVCPACRRGEPTVCHASYDETGFTRDGAWADHLVLPAHLLHLLPPDADLRAAAGLEPSACAAEACLRAGSVTAARVAVIGGGTLGLLATQMLKATSPAELVVVEPYSARRDVALRCGATALVTTAEADTLAERFDVVIEAAGARGTAALAVRMVRRGGRVVLTGIPAADDEISTRELVTKQLTVDTVFGAPPRAWIHAVNAFAAGLLDPSVLVTHEFVLEDAHQALKMIAQHDPAVGKVLLHP